METTRPTLALIAGRLIGAVATFAIPAVLVRTFDPTEVGTYRELFLIFTSVYVLAQFGLFESLYYFVPTNRDAAGAFVANTVVALTVIGVGCAVAGTWVAPGIASWFDNPALERHVPMLAIWVGIMLITAGLEVVMTARKRYAAAAVTYAGSDLLRAAALTLPAVVFGTVQAMLAGAVAFATVRLLYLFSYLRQEFGASLHVSRPRWREQLIYAVPFGAGAAIEIVQVHYHQYAVASWFDTHTFAIYSIACLQLPVVELLGTSAINVMMVAMAERIGDGRAMLALWHQTISRLMLMFVPMVALLLLVAHDLITFLYTDAFAASAPIFMLSLAAIVMYAIPVDGVLRVFARTRFILGMNIFRLAFIALTIGPFVSAFGLIGAMLSTLAGTAIVKLAALVRIRRLLDVPAVDLMPWRALAKTALATALASAAGYFVNTGWALPTLLQLAVVTLVFGATCLAVLTVLHARPMLRALLPEAERAR